MYACRMLIKIKLGSNDIDEEKQAFVQAGAQAAAQAAWVELGRPLTAIGLNAPIVQQMAVPTPPGQVLNLPIISLPIGSEVKTVLCTPGDVERWAVVHFTFGTLNLINPQGTRSGPLVGFHPLLPHEDKIAPFILSKSKVDVQVSAAVQNVSYRYGGASPSAEVADAKGPTNKKGSKSRKRAGARSASAVESAIPAPVAQSPRAGRGVEAIFRGFSILAYQEEQVCAIQTRVESTDRPVGSVELLHLFRRSVGDMCIRQQARYVQSKDPVQVKVTRVVAAAGNLSDAVKSLFGGSAPPTPTGHPSYVTSPIR